MLKKTIRLMLVCSLVALGSATYAAAQGNLTNRTVLTFTQPIEVPGKVLPAGTYTFELHETQSNRHLIEIFDQGGTKLITTVMAIPSYRTKQTEDTVIKFAEVPVGQPQAMKIWYYPGQLVGHELIYSKSRARELAVAMNTAVVAVDDIAYTAMKPDTTLAVVVIDADKTEKPVPPPPTPEPVVPTPEPALVVAAPVAPAPMPTPVVVETRDELPRTASTLPMIALLGFVILGSGLVMRSRANRRAER